MPDISAFRGIRYDLGHVGSLSNVIAPPYDVIDAELQDALYAKHPANVVRLILNKDEPGDDEHNNRYTRAARLLRMWQREGVLFTEADPAIYVYHQVFNEGGVEYTRRGFMCRVRLERFGEGNIYPHEETHGGAKADRLKLWTACKANLSQIFGLYPDAAEHGPGLARGRDRGRRAARSDRSPGRHPSHLAGEGYQRDHRSDRRDGRPARLHCRRPPPLRNGLHAPRRIAQRRTAARFRQSIRPTTC